MASYQDRGARGAEEERGQSAEMQGQMQWKWEGEKKQPVEYGHAEFDFTKDNAGEEQEARPQGSRENNNTNGLEVGQYLSVKDLIVNYSQQAPEVTNDPRSFSALGGAKSVTPLATFPEE